MILATTDLDKSPKPLLVHFGIMREFTEPADGCPRICELAREKGLRCIVLRPLRARPRLRTPGYGEVDDVYEARDTQ